MKKIFIIISVLIVISLAWLVFNSSSKPAGLNLNINQPAEATPVSTLKPSEVTVGLYDPAPEPSQLTKLFDSRLKEIGFKTAIFNELVDPDAANQEKTTLLFRQSTQKAMELVSREVIKSNLYRKGQNDGIEQDVVISAWNIEDINWGSFADLAEQYNNPDPAATSVLVLNAGAESGAAGELVEILKQNGFSQAAAENSELNPGQPALIYYQRNYKNLAKTLRQLLAANGYPDVTYRSQLSQPANIVIVLGPAIEPSADQVSE